MTKPSATSTGKDELPAERRKKPQGVVSIDTERCKGCCYCVEFCPVKCLILSSKYNAKGYHYPEKKPDVDCTGCDLCGMYCPDFAIHGQRVSSKDSDKE